MTEPLTGMIFDIQHYAVYDGPGIRTSVYFKGCPLRCVWCHNPESQKHEPEISYFKDRCTACGACVDACANKAVRLVQGRVVRDADRCKVCGACAAACKTRATELIGREMSVQQVVDKVVQDKPFYDNSGGGATISGGEATAQPDFLLALLRALKEHQIHTALETCGCFKPGLLKDLCALVDLFLYDFKHADSGEHKRFTGVDNVQILENFRAVLDCAGPDRVIPRIPLIPGANADDNTIKGIIHILKDAGYAGAVHLMPYNALARTKWEKIGRARDYADMGALADTDIRRVSGLFENAGFTVSVNH